MLSLSRSLGAFRDSEEGSRIIKHPSGYTRLTAEKYTAHRQKGQGLCCRRNLSQASHCKRIEKWTTGKSAMHRSIGILNCSLRAVRSKSWRSFCFWGFPKTLLTCWQSATVDCKICIWFSLKHTWISDFWKFGKQAPLENNRYSEGPVWVICFLEIRGSMASVFVLLETFNRKGAAALGNFPCATAASEN